MTRDEFIDGYCKKSGITREFFFENGDAVPCDCGEDGCAGWQYDTSRSPACDGLSGYREEAGVIYASEDVIHLTGSAEAAPSLPDSVGRVYFFKDAFEAGTLRFAMNNKPVVCFKPDGTIEMGEGYTPTEAAEEFITILRDALPSRMNSSREALDYANRKLEVYGARIAALEGGIVAENKRTSVIERELQAVKDLLVGRDEDFHPKGAATVAEVVERILGERSLLADQLHSSEQDNIRVVGERDAALNCLDREREAWDREQVVLTARIESVAHDHAKAIAERDEVRNEWKALGATVAEACGLDAADVAHIVSAAQMRRMSKERDAARSERDTLGRRVEDAQAALNECGAGFTGQPEATRIRDLRARLARHEAVVEALPRCEHRFGCAARSTRSDGYTTFCDEHGGDWPLLPWHAAIRALESPEETSGGSGAAHDGGRLMPGPTVATADPPKPAGGCDHKHRRCENDHDACVDCGAVNRAVTGLADWGPAAPAGASAAARPDCECLDWTQVGHPASAYWPDLHPNYHHPDCAKYVAPLTCERPGCGARAAHAEHFHDRVRAWCAAHVPWSGHHECCDDFCRVLLNAGKC